MAFLFCTSVALVAALNEHAHDASLYGRDVRRELPASQCGCPLESEYHSRRFLRRIRLKYVFALRNGWRAVRFPLDCEPVLPQVDRDGSGGTTPPEDGQEVGRVGFLRERRHGERILDFGCATCH